MKVFTIKLFRLCVLLGAASTVGGAHAYQPYGYQAPQGMYPQQYPQQQYPQQQYPQQQYPQQQYPDNRNPVQPQQPYWYPYQQPQQQQYQQYQPQQRYTPPRIETSISDPAPFEQQSLIYKIRLISSGNLKTATPEAPQSESAVVRKLGDPVTESGKNGGGQEIVTEYRYLLMPLASGVIELPPARVNGTYAASGGGDGPPFEVSGEPVIMKVRAATEAVQPWLPLYNLQIDARVRGTERPAAGNPIKLDVETRAVGATGSQIPSVASQLNSQEFRIYPGKSVTEGRISADGRTLLGKRVESFTLVPQYGGWLKLPTVTINWWNVRYNRPEVAALLTDQINVMGPANPERGRGVRGEDSSGPVSSLFFWLPMMAAVAILVYGWMNAFLGEGTLPGSEQLKKTFRPMLGELYAPFVALASRISPRRSFHRLRAWTGKRLPVSWKLWFCLRVVAREDDPAEWAHALQFLAAKHLGVRPQAHLRHLGSSIAAYHPGASARQVDRLMAELDEAVYGDKPIKSFARWKREFASQIKPSLVPVRLRRGFRGAGRARELPQLNPN